MVRPFFKWIVSADAAPEASASIIADRVVTRSCIEAHSSNDASAHPRDQSTGNATQVERDSGGVRCDSAIRTAGLLAGNPCAPTRAGGASVSATQYHWA